MIDTNNRLAEQLKLYAVLETDMLQMPLDDFLCDIIRGGFTAIQLRDKEHTARQRYETGLAIKHRLDKSGVLFIVNDSIELALALDADGVHLGINDLPPDTARALMRDKIIGYSCNNETDCAEAKKSADYAGIGPVFHTGTKKDLREVIGFEGLKRNAALVAVPCVAIGGITESNIRETLACGVSGVAVSSYLCASHEPYNAASALRTIIDERI